MGASSYWSTRNRSAPIPLCPQLIDQINVDLTPFKSPQLKTLLRNLFLEKPMWKLVVGFIVFAGVALFVISKGGDSLDMSGEKHGAEAVHSPAPAPAAPAAPAAADAAPAAPATTPAAAPAAAPAPAGK
jgi:hypothetical protein